MSVSYMLNCDNCKSVFESEEGFPKPHLCPRCLIVFKAGYEEGMKSQKTPRTDLECELADEEFRKEFHIARKETDMEMYKAGIKEVVAWVKYCPHCGSYLPKNLNETRMLKCNVCDWDGQAQLKEWGL